MTRTELGARVRDLVADQVRRYPAAKTLPSAIQDQHRIVADLGLDSIDTVELSMSIEDALDLELDDEKVAELVTVADLIAYLADLVGVAEVAA